MLTVGSSADLKGDVTTLNWIGPRPPAEIEKALGFQAGRLAAGYWIVVLKEPLQPIDFEFGGTTLRSGGRLGLPASSNAADARRPRVHDQVMAERGQAGYEALQRQALATAQITGSNRIAKVIPVTPHDPAMAPDLQYPMGGGGLQWKLKNKKRFLVALEVTPSGEAIAPSFRVSLAPGQRGDQLYANRAKVAQHLATA